MSIYFEERGTKTAPTILFVHGAFTDSRSLINQVEHFNDYHCILVDLPECGKSYNVTPFTFAKSAEHIAQIIKSAANGGKAHVVGHSFGGIVVRKLLSINPELVDHAVIGSANLRTSNFYSFGASLIGSNYCYLLNKKNFKKENISFDLYRRTMKDAIDNFVIPDELYKVKTPTLLVAGEKEPKFIKESNKDLLKVLENSKAVIIRNAKHNYYCDNYEIFNTLIRNWISDSDITNENIISI